MAAKLRIGLVTYGLDRPLSGVTRFALGLGQSLPLLDSCDVFYLTPYLRGEFRARGGGSWYLPGCSRLPALMLLGGPAIALAARALKLDVVHDPTGVSPFTLGRWAGRFKRVTTIHDAIAFRYPQGYPWLNNFLHRRFVPATIRHLDAVTTVSSDAKRDLTHFMKLPASQIYVVPSAVGDHFQPAPPDVAAEVRSRYGLGSGEFVLSVGAQQERKNVPMIVRAFARLHRTDSRYGLVVTGPTQWTSGSVMDLATELGVAGAVKVLGYVPEPDLPALYSAASLFVFPSLYEGFGLPPLEAMACGTPVVCSNATSLPEVVGEAAIMVDPRNEEEIAAAMHRGLVDAALRSRLRPMGIERASQFSWAAAAAKMLAVYRDVAVA